MLRRGARVCLGDLGHRQGPRSGRRRRSRRRLNPWAADVGWLLMPIYVSERFNGATARGNRGKSVQEVNIKRTENVSKRHGGTLIN